MASIQPAPTIAAKLTAFLASPKDWDNWFAVTKSYATLQKVWHLVNPELDNEPVSRREPRELEPADANDNSNYPNFFHYFYCFFDRFS